MREVNIATTEETVETYKTTTNIFEPMFREIKEIGKKKPELVVSKFKVLQVNRLLKDIQAFLKDAPEGKYLDLLDEDTLPQAADIILVMSQYEGALNAFRTRHHGEYPGGYGWYIEEED